MHLYSKFQIIHAVAVAAVFGACNRGVSHLGMGNLTGSSGDEGAACGGSTIQKIGRKINQKIADVAKERVGDTDWAYGRKKDNFPANSWKCNKFVHDVLQEAGITPPTKTDSSGTWPIRAADWASSAWIKNWEYKGPTTDWKPGDVIAQAKRFDRIDAKSSGHCGIVVGDGTVVAAGREEVYMNDDPTLPCGAAIVRRFTADL